MRARRSAGGGRERENLLRLLSFCASSLITPTSTRRFAQESDSSAAAMAGTHDTTNRHRSERR